MEERALQVLEFHLFLRQLQATASTEVGGALCLSLRPQLRMDAIEALLREVAEAIDVLRETGDLPLEGSAELRPLLRQARVEGACLLPEELLPVRATLGAVRRVKLFLGNLGEHHPILQAVGEELPDLRPLHKLLQSSLGPRGEVLDGASPELRRIRGEISRIRNRIRRTLEGLWSREEIKRSFQEQIITLRNERYVVAVKAEFKSSVPGIIHDQSQSRATYFIEPLATVEENNEMNLLLKDEKEEERRILLEITDRIREMADEIARAVEALGRLDLIFAKAKYARSVNGTIPLLNDRGQWRLRDARHPLLDLRSVVPIDLQIAPGKSTLIITGANAGGKTVALKTLGLLTLMTQSGIPIPAAEGSQVAVFQKIFADIGDEQSLQAHLSTFTAWVQSLAHILEKADSSSLVLLDEVGGGTDPTEGAVLGMALIDGLRARGAKTIVTTHLQMLKAYGAIHGDVENVSVAFNPDSLQPSYQLLYGHPGESYALLMAERCGLPHELIERAKGYMGEGDQRVREMLQGLERARSETEANQKESQKVRREAEGIRKEAEESLRRARTEQEALLVRAREEAQSLVRQSKEDLRGLINDFKARGRTDLHSLAEKIKEEEKKIQAFGPQEHPKELGREGAAGFHSIRFGRGPEVRGIRTEKKAVSGRGGQVHYEIPAAPREIKVIGLHVEEAIPEIDKALDEAYLAGLKELDIIHGAGTGRLRRAIRDYLRSHHFVKGFLPGGPGRGGDGVTVVELGPTPPGVNRSPH